MKLSISRKKLFIAFLILVPFWIIAYIISYFIFISDFCHRTWPHDYTRKHCVYIGRKAIQFLEKNPIIGIFTSKKLMKSDFLPQKYVNQVYELLSFIDFVFTKHNIEYSIDFGTELGAIRHGGFIPWDDDIDLLVFSSEKETIDALREEIKNEKMENRFIVIESENNVGSVQWSVIKVKDGIVADLFCNKNIVKCRFDRFDNQERYFLSENGSCDKLVFYPYSFAHDEIWPLKKCADIFAKQAEYVSAVREERCCKNI